MPDPAQPASRPALNERALLVALAAIQFTHIMDFMIMMPLGAGLMRVFSISPAQFSLLVASYGLAAAVTGFLGGFVLDRFDRKQALLLLYAGFGLATLACALAPTYGFLMAARVAAGACGGVAGSLVTAMVGDAIPPERRGRAMGTVMTAFPVASVLGVPVGLLLAGSLGWHAPFFMLAGLSVAIWCLARRVLPHIERPLSEVHPVRQMFEIVTHRVHLRGFLLSAVLVFAGAIVIPFMAPSMIANVGLNEQWQVPLVYLFGGACTFFTMPWFGRLSDRHDKLYVLGWVSLIALVSRHVPSASLSYRRSGHFRPAAPAGVARSGGRLGMRACRRRERRRRHLLRLERFNARMRAKNFTQADLPALMEFFTGAASGGT
jgi:DHA1 family inner membrane transport protein